MNVVGASACSILFVVLLSAAKADEGNDNSTLELVHVFFRHGSRTPEFRDLYPNDPYTLKDFQPMGYGQLTNSGKERAYLLGNLLRKRYNTFLGEIYTPEIVAATSTDFDRTKMTALLVLAGLFPPSASQKWNDHVNWLPIPFYFEKNKEDYTMRRSLHYCPTYGKELESVVNSKEVQDLVADYKKMFQYVSEYAGKQMETLMDMFRLYQTLTAEHFMNLTLPKWTTSIYPDHLHTLAGMQCYYENKNAVLKRLNGGRMLKQVIENMNAKVNNTLMPGRKIYLYSGHENNVINILAALNLFEPHVPPYSAAVIIELHRLPTSSGYGVKVFYAKHISGEPKEQTLAGCSSLCPLDKFLQITKPHIPVNYTEECNSKINLDTNRIM